MEVDPPIGRQVQPGRSGGVAPSIGAPSASDHVPLLAGVLAVDVAGRRVLGEVYSGQPLYVACCGAVVGRVAVPSMAASTPSPAVAGPASDGQAARHSPVHVLGPWLSGTNM